MENIFNNKMSNDIHNIQQLLDNMIRQTKEGSQNNKARSIDEPRHSYAYASMLMYNSY